MLWRFDTMTGRSVPAGIRYGQALYMIRGWRKRAQRFPLPEAA